MATPFEITDYIKLEQTKAVYANTKVLVIGIAVVTAVTSFVFFNEVSFSWLVAWWLAAAFIIVSRLITFRKFSSLRITASDAGYWLGLSCFWSFLTGLHWGAVPLLFLDSEATLLTLFVSIVYTGHLAGAVSTNAAYARGLLFVGLPTTTCFAGRFFYEGGTFYNTVAVMVLFYFFVCLALSRNSEKLFREARELTFKNMRLSRDLLEQKQAAEAATRTKDRFLAAASHDLRQPLHSTGLLLSALDRHVQHEEGKEILADIKASTQALNHSFSGLLDVSRLDAGVVTAEKRHWRCDELLLLRIKDARLKAAEKNLKLKVTMDDSVVFTDSVLFDRLIGNLLSNAINYTQAGEITLDCRRLGNGLVRILIRDTGIGIAAEELSDIFSEYYQINNPERDRDKGFGLGLAIVARLCEVLSANIYLCSEENVETCFAVYLQAGEANKVRRSEIKTPAVGDLQGMIILVIDDDAVVLKSMRTLLQSWGAEVFCADSEGQAKEKLQALSSAPDLIISDYRLRDKADGVQVLKSLFNELQAQVPALIITGDTSPERLKSIEASGFPVLHKPVKPALLRSAVQNSVVP